MPQCQFLFSAIFGSRKAVRAIFSEFDETKAKPPIFSRDTRSQKGKPGGGPGPPPHRAARPGPQARRRVGSPPRDSTDIAPLPIYSPHDAKTRDISIILQKDSRSAAAIAKPSFGGQKFLFRHPAGTGIAPGAISTAVFTAIFTAIANSMMRRE